MPLNSHVLCLLDEPFTLECYHPFRRRFLMKVENEAEFKLWADVLEKCCESADGRKIVDDEVALASYDEAFDETRSPLSVPYYQTFGGSEEDRITDLLMMHVKRVHLTPIFAGLQAPSASLRVTLHGKVIDVVRGIVSGAATAAWRAVYGATQASRPKIEEALGKVVDPIRTTEATLTEKGTEKTLGAINPVREKALNPLSSLLVKVVLGDTVKSYSAVEKIFRERTDAYIEKCAGKADALDANFDSLKSEARYRNVMDPSFSCLGSLLSPLPELVAKIPGVGGEITGVVDKVAEVLSLRDYVYGTEDSLSVITKQAFFTFKEDAKRIAGEGKSVQDAAIDAQKATLEKFRHDANLDITGRLRAFLGGGIGSVVKDQLLSLCAPLVEPLDSVIPEAVREFVSASKILDKILENVVSDVTEKAIEEIAKDIKL